MPYIIQKIRLPIDDNETKSLGCGGLSYKLIAVVRDYLDQHHNGGWNGAIAHVLVVLEGARIGVRGHTMRGKGVWLADVRITIQSDEANFSRYTLPDFPQYTCEEPNQTL